MANNPSAKKRHRQSLKRRTRNRDVLAHMRKAVRQARDARESGAAEAPELVKTAERLLRKAGSKGMIHGRKVDRTVARLSTPPR